MEVVIDQYSGFCFGVIKAIHAAEIHIADNSSKLFCLGEIVHNNEEVNRLEKEGLITIQHQQINQINGERMLIRAHGEPPETYSLAKQSDVKLIDATCPVVLKLQQNIRKGYKEMLLIDGQIIIYGKEGHAEVNGLVGQTNNSAIVIGSLDDIGKIDFNKPARLYSQTTQNVEDFKMLVENIEHEFAKNKPKEIHFFMAFDTICRQVSNRAPQLRIFASSHQVILFVSGKQSSNGKYLYQICKKVNINTYFISSIEEIQTQWFLNVNSVGVCGATSTPMWLMEQVALFVKSI
ncbi:MAG: 4-hydroxy-3-methylbut-2-enyl diphosphate reductase [Bacteroidota bacterium]